MMISLSDQFSAARLTQLDNGFNLMRSLGEQALDRADRLFALQLDASRAAVEQSSNAMRQLLSARDPHDLLAIGSQSQQQWRSVVDYSRELFSIAAGLGSTMLRSYRVDSLAAPAQEAQVAAEAFERIGADSASIAASEVANAASASASATASDTASATAPATAPSIILQTETPPPGGDFILPTETPTEPPVIVTSTVEPAATPNPIARAAGAALDVPVAPPHPLAASVPVEVAVEIELPKVEPVEATPPPAAPTTGPVETRGGKGRKRSS